MKKSLPAWRQFEQLVARIESDAGPVGLIVTSPDHIRCKITGRLREVDASVKTQTGALVTIECRNRSAKQDVTWIEQLATKKHAIGASRTIAVSSSGFSLEAEVAARHYEIDLRRVSEVSVEEINKMMLLDFVLFAHKRCSLFRVGINFFRSLNWKMPGSQKVDFILPSDTDLFCPLFKNIETGVTWSINDLWLQLQDATNPFVGIEKGAKPEIKTAGFPYPGNVIVDTLDGPKNIGDVLLSVALSIEMEKVDLEFAKKIEYTSSNGVAIQRVEFVSNESVVEDWRISLQIPKGSEDMRKLRVGGSWPSDNQSI